MTVRDHGNKCEMTEADEALLRSNQRLALLAETAALLLSGDCPREVMNSLCGKVLAFLDCQAFFNYIVDEEKKRLHLNACGGIPEADVRKMEWLDYGVGLCGCSARDGCRLVVEDVQGTQDQYTDLVKPFGIQAYACHPLISQGKVLGTLSFCSRNRTRFTDDELSLMMAVANLVSISLERINSEEKLRRANDYLEECVAERTGQLTRAVSDLQQEIAARQRTEAALRRSEMRYRAVVEDQTEVICRFLADGTFTFVNDVYCRFFGKTHQELLGTKWQPGALPGDLELIEAQLATLSPANPVVIVENRVYSGGGEVRWMQFVNRGYFDNGGQLAEIQSVGRDITDRKQAEAERLEMERKMLCAQKLESLGVLAGGIAHDFNNLLAVILGNLDLALLELPPDSPVSEHIKDAMLASERAADLTRQMLAYSGKSLFVLKETDLNDVIRGNEALLRSSVGRNVTLDIRTTPNLPTIKTDQGQLKQMILNLLINASEAIGDDPGLITVRTGIRNCDDQYLDMSLLEEKPPAGRFIYIKVSDTGCGMDEETQRRLFEPFFTTKFPGRGLGMSAVQGIVRAHNGVILLKSEVGRGSVVRVLLPVNTSTGD